jgi:micrococcal nuclease
VDIRGYGYYGRALAMVYLPDGTCYNERVVADGYACVYKYHGHKSKQLSWEEFNKLNRLMQEAREHKKGLWGRDYRVMERLCE